MLVLQERGAKRPEEHGEKRSSHFLSTPLLFNMQSARYYFYGSILLQFKVFLWAVSAMSQLLPTA